MHILLKLSFICFIALINHNNNVPNSATEESAYLPSGYIRKDESNVSSPALFNCQRHKIIPEL